MKDPILIDQEVKKRRQLAATIDPLKKRKKLLEKEHQKVQKSMDKLLDAYQEHLLPLKELNSQVMKMTVTEERLRQKGYLSFLEYYLKVKHRKPAKSSTKRK